MASDDVSPGFWLEFSSSDFSFSVGSELRLLLQREFMEQWASFGIWRMRLKEKGNYFFSSGPEEQFESLFDGSLCFF